MVSTKSANKSTFEQPCSTFPSIILHRDRHLLVECPESGGNARSDPPNHFYEQPHCFGLHLRKVHNIGDGTAMNLLENYWQSFQVLSPSDPSDLESGDFKLPRKLVVKKHGEHAQEVKCKNTTIVLEEYPTVARKPYSTYDELSCCFRDGGNAVIRRGGRGARGKPPLTYARGVRGLSSHIAQAHNIEAGGSSKDLHWLFEHCGKPISEERFQQLKKDSTGGLIPKEMLMTEHKRHFKTTQGLDMVEQQLAFSDSESAAALEPTVHQHRPKNDAAEKTKQASPQHSRHNHLTNQTRFARIIGNRDPCVEYERPISGMTEAERTFRQASRYWPYGPRYLFNSFL